MWISASFWCVQKFNLPSFSSEVRAPSELVYSFSCCCRGHPFPTMPFVAGRGKAVLSISSLALNPAVHTRATNWHSSMCLSAASLGSFNSAGEAVFRPLRAGLEVLRHISTLSLYYLTSFPPAEHPTCVYHVNCSCFSFSLFCELCEVWLSVFPRPISRSSLSWYHAQALFLLSNHF